MGQKYGIRNAGYYALRSLRIEKFFAFWGQDLDAFTTPLECGREFRVKFDKVCLSGRIHEIQCHRVDMSVCHSTSGHILSVKEFLAKFNRFVVFYSIQVRHLFSKKTTRLWIINSLF